MYACVFVSCVKVTKKRKKKGWKKRERERQAIGEIEVTLLPDARKIRGKTRGNKQFTHTVDNSGCLECVRVSERDTFLFVK